MISKIIQYFLSHKLLSYLLLLSLILWGISVTPFFRATGMLPQDPVPVDAIPDLGENQQIVYTEWPGRSPQDVEDQVTYPLTTALMGLPGIKTVRSNSMLGFSSIYVIFEEDVEFYWSRSRILEKLNALPPGTLPAGVSPALGPDATGLGQIYWYTLEGRDPSSGEPRGGWDPQELRSLQDFYLQYALSATPGVAEVASIGGYVQEYQVDIDPDALVGYEVTLAQVMRAIRESNLDVGARTLEFNQVEYAVRGLGYLRSIDDLQQSVVTTRGQVPVRLGDVARIQMGPAHRRGGLDKGGAEAVGGVVVARYGTNPMAVIEALEEKIAEVQAGLPEKTLSDGSRSQVTIVPFYNRRSLINETLGTLQAALTHEILISILVVLVLVFRLRAALLISGLLPLGILLTFILMRYTGVEANIVALSGIAIAIGVMVDVGVVIVENIMRHLGEAAPHQKRGPGLQKLIFNSTVEVAPAVVTALATTVISFIPVFTLQAAEGKLFHPLAFTKTYAVLASLVIGLLFIPLLAQAIFGLRWQPGRFRKWLGIALIPIGIFWMLYFDQPLAWALVVLGVQRVAEPWLEQRFPGASKRLLIGLTLAAVAWLLAREWLPLGAAHSLSANFLLVVVLLAMILGGLYAVVYYYTQILSWCLEHKKTFLVLPLASLLLGLLLWQGWPRLSSGLSSWARAAGLPVEQWALWQTMAAQFPGMGSEFMPTLNEGSFLLMPSNMAHAGVDYNVEVLRRIDQQVQALPEVSQAVGKWGRVNSALDPAPASMYEIIVNYHPEFLSDEQGRPIRYQTNDEGHFRLRNGQRYNPGKDDFSNLDPQLLIPDAQGQFLRIWRPHIRSKEDIWQEVSAAAQYPGLTQAPELQPIQTRLLMLQTGMRAPFGLKVYGESLSQLQEAGAALEEALKKIPGINPATVYADRPVGKPYLNLRLLRPQMARYGLSVEQLQSYISTAVGGLELTTTVEGRQRFAVRLRYPRAYRERPEDLLDIRVPAANGVSIPLREVVALEYERGPQSIKSEDTFLMSYVIFDKEEGYSETEVVQAAQQVLQLQRKEGRLQLPPGVNYEFTGNYQNQVRAQKRLQLVVPLCLLIIFLILYWQFRSTLTALMIFSGILVAFSGGFMMLWLYGQPDFLQWGWGDWSFRQIFQVKPVNLSVAVWVGFIALFGIATDDGVLMGTYLKQVFAESDPQNRAGIRAAVVKAGTRRVKAATMTTATALIALLPVLSSTGKGSDIMVPMAIPLFGGMLLQVMTMFVVPVLYSLWQEQRLKPSPTKKTLS